jgi:hypothetical protein
MESFTKRLVDGIHLRHLFFKTCDKSFSVQLLDKLRGYELGGIASLCFGASINPG